MITEDYVSFETAKLLKEKGFDDIDCECYGWIGRSGKHYSVDDTFYDDEELKMAQEDRKDFVPLITLQMAMKWLREVHNIGIFPSTYTITNSKGSKEEHVYGSAIVNLITFDLMCDDIMSNSSYEKACEDAIKYCLENLI